MNDSPWLCRLCSPRSCGPRDPDLSKHAKCPMYSFRRAGTHRRLMLQRRALAAGARPARNHCHIFGGGNSACRLLRSVRRLRQLPRPALIFLHHFLLTKIVSCERSSPSSRIWRTAGIVAGHKFRSAGDSRSSCTLRTGSIWKGWFIASRLPRARYNKASEASCEITLGLGGFDSVLLTGFQRSHIPGKKALRFLDVRTTGRSLQRTDPDGPPR